MADREKAVVRFEFDPIYRIFDGDSVQAMVSARFEKDRASWVKLLLEAIQLYDAEPSRPVATDAMPSAIALSERTLTTALRHFAHEGILRRTSYQPPVFTFLDPVPLDDGHLLRYNPFAQRIAEELQDVREPLPYEIQLAYQWKTYPGLQEEVILEVLHQALRKDPHSGIKSAEPLLPLIKWARTRKEAAEALAEHVQIYAAAKEVLLRLGQEREPSAREIELYVAWRKTWGFTHEAILEACAAAARGDPNFDYLNGILRNIHHESRPEGSMDAEKLPADAEDRGTLDAEDVREAFRISEECREICRVAGSRFSTEHLEEYRQLRARFDPGLISLAAKESGKNHAGFQGIIKYLVSWERQGLQSLEDISAYQAEIREQFDLMSDLFAQWGLERKPTARDCRLARQWINAGISQEMIFAAAEYAFAAEDPPLYTAKVLRRFQEKGITTPRQAELDHQAHLRERVQGEEKAGKRSGQAQYHRESTTGPHAGEHPSSEPGQEDEDAFLRLMLPDDSLLSRD